MPRRFESPISVLLVLTAACAHGLEDDRSLGDFTPAGTGGSAGTATIAATGGRAGNSVEAGSGGAGGIVGGAAGLGRAGSSSGGLAGNGGGASTTSTGTGGVAGTGGAVGTGGAGASGRDGGDSDVVSDGALSNDANSAVDASCVRESIVAFCLRLAKNCGNVIANDNCGNQTTANCGTCGALLMCGGGGQPNLCGALTGAAMGGLVTSSNPGVMPEDMTRAFDGSTVTKWYAGDNIRTGFLAYQFGAMASHTATSYSITSANDVPARDPSAWQVQGSNDGQTWTTLDTRTGQTFANRFQTNSYVVTTTGAYSRYRLNVTANNGGTDLQLAELVFFGQ